MKYFLIFAILALPVAGFPLGDIKSVDDSVLRGSRTCILHDSGAQNADVVIICNGKVAVAAEQTKHVTELDTDSLRLSRILEIMYNAGFEVIQNTGSPRIFVKKHL